LRILVTGATGMLGCDICGELSKEHEIIGLAKGEYTLTTHDSRLTTFLRVDITDKSAIGDALANAKPDMVIHAAAYTDVDGCELNPDIAYQVNALGTRNVANSCRDTNALLLYISTDYVFDGEKGSPYDEEDGPNPISVYGSSKLQGEQEVKAALKAYMIVRTSWLYGRNGRNFIDGVIERARRGEELRVVDDQFGSPTQTVDLAMAIRRMVERARDLSGTYHITNSGSCSRLDEARKALEYSKCENARVIPISSSESVRPARRPKNSALENRRYREIFGQELRPWDAALKAYLSSS